MQTLSNEPLTRRRLGLALLAAPVLAWLVKPSLEFRSAMLAVKGEHNKVSCATIRWRCRWLLRNGAQRVWFRW